MSKKTSKLFIQLLDSWEALKKAKKKLNWKPKHNLKSLVNDMINEELTN